MMKKRLIFTLLLAAFIVACFAQKPYKVMFYNLENFFDTINDPEVLDDEFTPEGPKQWNSAKYNRKLGNTERVLFDLAAADKVYRPEVFKLEGSYPVKTVVPSLPNFKTRDILTMWGRIDDEPFFFMVAHWPSRLGGKDASEFKRIAVGEQMRRIADSVLKADPATRIVAMGDFNDDPTDPSMAEGLGARTRMKELEPGDFYNPFGDMLRAGIGTLAYGDAWNLFDNIVVSGNMVSGDDGMQLRKAPGSKYYGNIFRRHYMVQREGQYKGYPLRTYVGNNFQGGYSDHFPVYIYFAK